jgi:hypothetical protein
MVRPNRNLGRAWQTRWIRMAARVAIVATMSVWSLGTLHATEHIDSDHVSACGTCVAVTAEALDHANGPCPDVAIAVEISPAQAPENESDGAREFRLTARAPPWALT